MENKTSELVFDKDFKPNYILGYDPYNEDNKSFSVGIISVPKRVYKLQKVKGFNRVIEKGYEYIIKLLK